MYPWPHLSTGVNVRICGEQYHSVLNKYLETKQRDYCFEIFINRPYISVFARAQTWSLSKMYKHHNTTKVLIGITPQGTISYVSLSWGGRTSNKYLTEKCGILNKLLPGDLVLADHGFTIAESVMFQQASLVALRKKQHQ